MLSRVKTGVRAFLGGGARRAPVAVKPARPRAAVDDGEVLTYDATNDIPCPPGPILTLHACPICGAAESTKVSRYNRFILFDRAPDAKAPVYNYSLCHSCGVVYAQQRPAGERYRWLLERFEETLGRTEAGAPRPGKFALSSSALGDEEREQLRRMVANGVFVSAHSGLTRKDYLPSLMNDRLASSMHVEILGSLLPLQSPRVLEIRSRLGSICAILQRLYGAECSAMALFENQRFLIHEVYGFPASCPIDFDAFDIPFEGRFDLVVSNHMLTHSVRPREFLATVRDRLVPGGYLYLYQEPMEGEFLDRGKSMFNTLNPFHLQTFNQPSAVRAIEANGFKVIFCAVRDDLFLALAQAIDPPNDHWERMSDSERSRRRSAYRVANDTAILRVPEHLRAPFAKDWDAIVERALGAGLATRASDGRIRVKRIEPALREP
jgi:SAM-dependent methyltransferase